MDILAGPKPGENANLGTSSKSESKTAITKENNAESKSAKSQPKSEKQAEQQVSKLAQALKEQDAISVDDLTSGLSQIKLSKNSQAQLAEVLGKSVFSKTISLQETVTALQQAIPRETAALVVEALQSLTKKNSEQIVTQIVSSSKVELFSVIAPGLTDAALEAFLTEKGLLFLLPVSDVTRQVAKSLAEGKESVDAVLAYINKEIDVKLSAASLASTVGAASAAAIFLNPEKADLEIISKFSKLIKRVTAQPSSDAMAQAAILFAMQNAWSNAKMPKGYRFNTLDDLSGHSVPY